MGAIAFNFFDGFIPFYKCEMLRNGYYKNMIEGEHGNRSFRCSGDLLLFNLK
jgi:hypothetical protein